MTEADLASPRVEAPRARLSLAWLIPLAALIIAGGAAWRHYASLGPRVTLVLENAAGVEAGRTPVRYRDVEIGRIESLGFTADFTRVEATARMSEAVRDHLREGARFWLVRPQLTASGVSGLDTLVSGVYVGADWGAEQDDSAPASVFDVAAAPPLTPSGTPGRRITLRASDASGLAPGAPVTFKGIEVGRIETRALSADGRQILFEAFVNAPHSDRIDAGARFWNASGVSLALGADGVRLDVDSLTSLLRGGVAFDRLGIQHAAPETAPADAEVFTLHASREAAAASLYADQPGSEVRFTAAFGQSVRGLRPGAPVEYRGVQIGAVEEIVIAPATSLDAVEIVATLLLQPRRIGLTETDPDAVRAYFARSVSRGLRARLSSGNLVTGALYVELVDVADAPPARLDEAAEPWPRLPAIPSTLDALRGRAEEVLARVSQLPIEELLASAIGALDNIGALVANPDLQRAPGELAAALTTARAMLDTLAQADLAGDMAQTMAAAGSAAQAFENAAAALPPLLRTLNAAAAKAEAAIDGFGPSAPLTTEAVAALREVRQAARALGALAQTLERRPNSLIIGR